MLLMEITVPAALLQQFFRKIDYEIMFAVVKFPLTLVLYKVQVGD